MWRRIHITGAAGAGVTALGAALAGRLNAAHLDSDDFYWLPTSPPYRLERDVAERLALLDAAFAKAEKWVLSGSCDSWIGSRAKSFDLVLFVVTPTPLRLARLGRRERCRFGEAALAEGGAMHDQHRAFLDWAAAYDTGAAAGRNRQRHELWLSQLACPVRRLDGSEALDVIVDRLLDGAE
jgi:adenylate kinase family enzyme